MVGIAFGRSLYTLGFFLLLLVHSFGGGEGVWLEIVVSLLVLLVMTMLS